MPATTNVGFKGIDVRKTGSPLILKASLKDSSGADLTSGSATVELYELQSDGSYKSFDFNDNTFKTTALTTATASLTRQTGNNGSTNTGVWTYAQSNVSGFTRGAVYLQKVRHSSAVPPAQEREWVYGDAEGDLSVSQDGVALSDLHLIVGRTVACDSPVTVAAYVGTAAASTAQTGDVFAKVGSLATGSIAGDLAAIQADVDTIVTAVSGDPTDAIDAGTAQAGGSTSVTLRAGAPSSLGVGSGFVTVVIVSGTGKGQIRRVTAYNGTTKVATVTPAWATNPDNTSHYAVYNGGEYVVTDTSGHVTLASAQTFDMTGNIAGNLSGSVGSVTGNVGGNVVGSVASVTNKTGFKLASDGLDSITVETGVNARQALSVNTAALAGVLAGAAGTTVTIAAANNSGTNRVTATVDQYGNRSAVTLNLPA